MSFSERLASHKADAPALVTADGRTIGYGELVEQIGAVRHALRSLKEEDRVAVLAEKGAEYVAALLGCWAAGVIAVPLCTSHPLPEMQYTVDDSQAAAILTTEHFAGRAAELASDGRVIRIDEALSERSDDVKRAVTDGGCLIIYTSGTTGRPKGALHTHASMRAQVESLNEAWQYKAGDRLLHVLPLHHIHGIVNALVATLYAGGCVELAPEKFDPAGVWARLQEKETPITLFMAVPTIYTKLLAAPPAERVDLSHIRLMVSGSAALPSSVKNKWRALTDHTLLERYGMTEIGMALSCGLEEGSRIDSSVGVPLPHVRAILVDSDGNEITEPDETGEIWVSGPTLFREYWGRPEQTAKEIADRDGVRWFKTGDVALVSSDVKFAGTWFIQGRSSVDIIKSGGYKISALDVERELLELPYVSEVAVLGVEDEEWGQRVAALVVPNSGQTVTLASLRADLKPKMAAYKIPSLLKAVDALPRNAMGKVNKKQLLEQFERQLKA